MSVGTNDPSKNTTRISGQIVPYFDYLKQLEIPYDDYQLIPDNNNNANTMCRRLNNKFNSNNDVKPQGYKTAKECAETCKGDLTCTSFDIARRRGNQYDCYHFNKPDLQAAFSASNAGCFRKRSDTKDNNNNDKNYINNTLDGYFTYDDKTSVYFKDKFVLLTDRGSNKTMCRYDNFNGSGVKYMKTIPANSCAEVCLKDSSCKAFDISRKNNNNYVCYHFTKGDNIKGVYNDVNNGCFLKK